MKKLESPRKTRTYSIRFDIDLEEFLNKQDKLSKLMNRLVWEEAIRQEKQEDQKNK